MGQNYVLLALPHYPPAGCAWEYGSGESAGSSALAGEPSEEPGKVSCHSFLPSTASQLPGGDLRAAEALPDGGGTWEATLPISYCLCVKLSVFQGSSSHHQHRRLQVSLVNPLLLPVTWAHGRLSLGEGIDFGRENRYCFGCCTSVPHFGGAPYLCDLLSFLRASPPFSLCTSEDEEEGVPQEETKLVCWEGGRSSHVSCLSSTGTTFNSTIRHL